MALHGVSFLHLTLLFAVAFAVESSVTEAACTRYVSSKCGHYSNYFNTYDSQVDQEHKTFDGIEAQLIYINVADENNNDQVCNKNNVMYSVVSFPYQIPRFKKKQTFTIAWQIILLYLRLFKTIIACQLSLDDQSHEVGRGSHMNLSEIWEIIVCIRRKVVA